MLGALDCGGGVVCCCDCDGFWPVPAPEPDCAPAGCEKIPKARSATTVVTQQRIFIENSSLECPTARQDEPAARQPTIGFAIRAPGNCQKLPGNSREFRRLRQ